MTAIRRLAPGDDAAFAAMLDVFAEAFDDAAAYRAARPGAAYRDRLLADDGFVALVAEDGAGVVGALTAYELRKFERERSEYAVYDLGVLKGWRRRGIATALIEAVRQIAAARADVVFIQADADNVDAARLYGRLGRRRSVFHFDIDARS